MSVYYKVPAELGIEQDMPLSLETQAFWDIEKNLSNNLEFIFTHSLTQSTESFSLDLASPSFHEVITVFNPLKYASVPHRDYLMKYFGQKDVLFVGMNPGRNGMGQTGIPFGDPTYVWDWLYITGADTVELPPGLRCDKREESGHRFWGLMKDICKTPQWFFRKCFVHNYCPLLFLDNHGNNKPLKEIPPEDLKQIEVHCDKALQECIRIIQPEIIVGIGDYAAERAQIASGRQDVAKILHPSPATRMDWNDEVRGELLYYNVMNYLSPELFKRHSKS